MNTAEKIKEIINRKALLEENIKQGNFILSSVNMSKTVSSWTLSNSRYDVKIEQEFFHESIRKQIDVDTFELNCINKKLEAIGALMGVE